MNTYFSKRMWILLWICLIILNVIMRIPVTPHEIGHDSFFIHFIADSLSTYGHANWVIHPLSLVGLYPFGIASALPFYFSGISQSMSLVMEYSIWLGLLLLGIFSAFTSYLMAGVIKNDKIFKFMTALVYSTSPGILTYTTWNASGRGLFLVLLPLFIYFLIKSRFSRTKYTLLTIVLLILLLATHNLFYLTFLIIMAALVAQLIRNIQIKSSNLFGGIILIIIFIGVFFELSMKAYTIKSIIFSFARYIGIMGFFAVGGFISLLFKKNKNFEEIFLILLLLFFTPTLSYLLYSKYFMLPFEALVISYGIFNLIKISKNKKIALNIIMLFVVFSIGFAQLYQFDDTNPETGNSPYTFSAEESIVNAAHWTKSYTNKIILTGEYTVSRRLLAYSDVTAFTEDNSVSLIQGNLGDFNVSTRSPTSVLFYSEGPFHAENITGMNSFFWLKLRDAGYDSQWMNSYLKRFDIKYYFKDERINSRFSILVNGSTDKLFDNGKFSVWDLENNTI